MIEHLVEDIILRLVVRSLAVEIFVSEIIVLLRDLFERLFLFDFFLFFLFSTGSRFALGFFRFFRGGSFRLDSNFLLFSTIGLFLSSFREFGFFLVRLRDCASRSALCEEREREREGEEEQNARYS